MKRGIVIFVLLATVGCFRDLPKDKPPYKVQTNMFEQPRYETQSESQFFPDHAAMRVPPTGTVARGFLNEDPVYYTGKDDRGQLVARIPLPVTSELMQRGQDRYNIYCTPCHGKLGDGQGMVVKRGLLPPPPYWDPRLLAVPDGHVFDVISNGIRNMPPYKYQIPVSDRWAVVAYFRALQRAHTATINDIPDAERAAMGQGSK
ncbi:MAG: cytochrome c [candidate division Zixibacteria bacterium]|nr:cytochrome c [candidate division Zixibacteria bacterium]